MICYYYWRANLRKKGPVLTGVESFLVSTEERQKNKKKICRNNIFKKANEERRFLLYEGRIISEVESRIFFWLFRYISFPWPFRSARTIIEMHAYLTVLPTSSPIVTKTVFFSFHPPTRWLPFDLVAQFSKNRQSRPTTYGLDENDVSLG